MTPGSPLLGPASAPAARAEHYLQARPHGGYSDGDVTRIVGLYYTTATAVGLDPLLAVAQMTEETAHLTSFWSQRPRRNFAGIGVTGQPGAGLSFPDLKTAVRAHTGRLLAYALPSGTGSPAQHQLIDEALAARPLPPHLRGAATTLGGLPAPGRRTRSTRSSWRRSRTPSARTAREHHRVPGRRLVVPRMPGARPGAQPSP